MYMLLPMLAFVISAVFLSGCSTRLSATANAAFFSYARLDQQAFHEVIREFRQAVPEGNRRVKITLTYEPSPEPPFYGAFKRMVISEAGRTSNFSRPELHTIEDMWPDDIQLSSPAIGDYVIVVPHGIPAASYSTILIRDFAFRGFTTVDPEIPPPPAYTPNKATGTDTRARISPNR